MPLASQSVESVVKAIFAKNRLQPADVGPIYLRATGVAYEVAVSPNLSPLAALGVVLQEMLDVGRERWFLTYLAASPKADVNLIGLLSRECPEILISQPPIDEQVSQLLNLLRRFKPALTTGPFPELIYNADLRTQVRAAIGDTVRLAAFAQQHEALRAFATAMTEAQEQPGSPLLGGGPEGLFGQGPSSLSALCVRARGLAATLEAEDRLDAEGWISGLEEIEATARSEVYGADSVVSEDALDELQSLVGIRLSLLGKEIFDISSRLALDALLSWAPDADALSAAWPTGAIDWSALPRSDLEFTVRGLGPTLLSRALVLKQWEQADRKLGLLAALIQNFTPGDVVALRDQWFPARKAIQILARSFGDDPWTQEEARLSALVDHEAFQADQATYGQDGAQRLARAIADYRRAVRYRLLALAVQLRADVQTLMRIERPVVDLLGPH